MTAASGWWCWVTAFLHTNRIKRIDTGQAQTLILDSTCPRLMSICECGALLDERLDLALAGLPASFQPIHRHSSISSVHTPNSTADLQSTISRRRSILRRAFVIAGAALLLQRRAHPG